MNQSRLISNKNNPLNNDLHQDFLSGTPLALSPSHKRSAGFLNAALFVWEVADASFKSGKTAGVHRVGPGDFLYGVDGRAGDGGGGDSFLGSEYGGRFGGI